MVTPLRWRKNTLVEYKITLHIGQKIAVGTCSKALYYCVRFEYIHAIIMLNTCAMLVGDHTADNLRNTQLLSRFVTKHVLKHHDGQSALDYLQSVVSLGLSHALPSLIFIYHDMRWINGLQFLSMYQQHFPQITARIVVLSHVHNAAEEHLYNAHFSVAAYLTLPLQEAQMHALQRGLNKNYLMPTPPPQGQLSIEHLPN